VSYPNFQLIATEQFPPPPRACRRVRLCKSARAKQRAHFKANCYL